jgi:hypothetical protein
MEMEKITAEWTAGFFCGEGYFYKQINGKYLQYSVGICMHIRDIGILNDICSAYGGKVRIRHDKISCDWRMSKRELLIHFAEAIKPYLRGYKLSQFNKWYDELIIK